MLSLADGCERIYDAKLGGAEEHGLLAASLMAVEGPGFVVRLTEQAPTSVSGAGRCRSQRARRRGKGRANAVGAIALKSVNLPRMVDGAKRYRVGVCCA